ncbi:DUF3054 domain-containing protein [Nesterenkonia lacusekhoensis]|uniref:DUF3054 domain-containing protein n=1 Tax=Nesterenkonia lacusekhoensis TaxID=150832 RepID=A0ABS4T0W1_9MICC|nr:DUF3054 domain-containing protein [Nesterenkonia lacusekhoensis]MBP2318082.1 hypothetical protein [Nesterenkonia lacusekhoensis]
MSSQSSQRHPALTHRTDAPLHSALCLLCDGLLVLVFALLGNRSHDSGLGLSEIISTAWPFLLGLALSWLLAFSWVSPNRIWPTGILVVLGTVIFGMTLRTLFTDGGTQLSFVLVATGVLAVFLLGRRVLSGMIRRRAHS